MSQKRVYLFGNGKAEGNAKMREELGGKGANLAEMNLLVRPKVMQRCVRNLVVRVLTLLR